MLILAEMAKLIILIGLPGSGKSTYLLELLNIGEIEEDCIYDDYHARAIDDSSSVFSSIHFQPLINNLKQGKTCVVSDIEFCNEIRWRALADGVRITMGKAELEIEVRYFANDPESSKHNVLLRGQKNLSRNVLEEVEKIDRLTKTYSIPNEIIPIPVKRGS